MSSLIETVKLQRDKLLYTISIKYNHILLDDLKKLCPFNEEEWLRHNEDIVIDNQEQVLERPVIIKTN